MSEWFDDKLYRRHPIEKHEDRVKAAVNYAIMHPGKRVGVVCDAHKADFYRAEIGKNEYVEILDDLAGPTPGAWTFAITRKLEINDE